MTQNPSNRESKPSSPFAQSWLPKIAWGLAFLMVFSVGFLLVQRFVFGVDIFVNLFAAPEPELADVLEEEPVVEEVPQLPGYEAGTNVMAVYRRANPYTVIPAKSRSTIEKYVVQSGDSVFSIANKYQLKPETVLWANYGQLDDNPNMLSVGMELDIPPVDGLYYTWEENDTVDTVATRYEVEPMAILTYTPNMLDLTNPVIAAGTTIMIPGGWRENRQWLVPTVWRANSGASQTIAGPGGCTLPDTGAYGTGAFIWPADNHYLSGNDYWSGHLGIDIAAADGAPLYAVDSGLVVYAGAIGGGYGNMVMIDHGNGYHSLYAHMSVVSVTCGQSVYQGNLIGLAGSTGNSTGPHLHFEIRYQGGFINPWYVLP